MARDSSGVWSLPSGNPVVAGTAVSETVHNTTMNEIAAELNKSSNALLAEYTISTDTSIDITSVIDSTYDAYMIRLIYVKTFNDVEQLKIRTTSDNGSSWDSGASDYAWQYSRNGASGADSADSAIVLTPFDIGTVEAYEVGVSGEIHLYSPSLAAATMVNYQMGYIDQSGAPIIMNGTGLKFAASAVNGLQILPASGTLTSGTIKVYGIR